jgi:hypothetical protein
VCPEQTIRKLPRRNGALDRRHRASRMQASGTQ